MAVEVLLRLWLLTGEQRYAAIAERVLKSFQSVSDTYPAGFGRLLCAYDLYFGPLRISSTGVSNAFPRMIWLL